jgi:23S rRNA U2552 (ribose-2'-O)-methylase RlmE/FtsJ
MRIIGALEHPRLKITVFSMDNRLSVKLENGLYEQIYRFRQGEGVDTLEEVSTRMDAQFLEEVEQVFVRMHQMRLQAANRQQTQREEEYFEEII